ncbi:MAG: PIN domain-containing protein [Terriglobia bacterium]
MSWNWETFIVRATFALGFVAASYHLRPFQLNSLMSIALGAVLGILAVFLEARLERASLKKLIGAVFGSILGVLVALMASHLLNLTLIEGKSLSFIQVALLMLLGYLGLILGANKGDLLNLAALGGVFNGERPVRKSFKILDTSVIIDGRIADVCETGFIDGALVVPQFVLRELQLVADSSDSMKRNRGRRGLDILQRIQKMTTVTVQIVEDDFPQVRDVDMKLIELAKLYEGKIVTNDFNLNKVAQLQGLPVLNINDLANALKPVVLPGEIMRVFILKEGKEYNQGVAYLDDGTMVVVDNAKKMISKTVDIAVTSVLQTTAGKMIFGKFDDRQRVEAIHQ